MFSTHECLEAKGYGRWLGLLPALVLGTICLAASSWPALASPPGALASAFASDADFEPMTTTEMAGQRGGFDGIAFGIFLSGTLSQPVTTTLPAGLTVSTLSPSQVQIVGGIGNLAGANGIFQITNIVGDMNVVNNNIIINVSIQPSSPTNAVSFIP
jgi:hypothetical protein